MTTCQAILSLLRTPHPDHPQAAKPGRPKEKPPMRRNDRGIALLLCIMALMVLTGIAIGLMYMTDSETLVNANYRTSQQAYFAALAGLQNVRQRMTPGLSAAQG